MPNNPLVSVVMPCYNANKYVQAAIESILRQTYDNLELIVVDDKSSDNSVEIINNFQDSRLRLLRNPTNQGVTRTLNRAIRVAEGEFIARMDADDLCEPTRIERQAEAMRRDPALAVVGTGVKIIDQNGMFLCYHFDPEGDREIRESLAYTLPIWPGTQMWRRASLLEAGLFDEEVPGCEDLELTLRLCRLGKAKNIKLPLYFYRRNYSGESNIAALSLMNRVMLARKTFILKIQGNGDALTRHYRDFAAHYKRTKFIKGKVPQKNQVYYYRNIALLGLINNNKKLSQSYIDKALKIEPWNVTNIIVAILIMMPQIVVSKLYSINRKIKKVIYKIYCGDIMKYLDIVSRG